MKNQYEQPNTIIYKNLGLIDYNDSLKYMIEATKNISKSQNIQIWNVEHPLVYTAGIKFDKNHILKSNSNSLNIQYIKRGGSITLHNPGQFVVYLISPISFLHFGLETFIRQVEGAIIQTLLEFQISSFIIPSYSGVFTRNGKIGFVGFGIKNRCTYHGLAVNLCNNLLPYNFIYSCGLQYKVTRLLDEIGQKEYSKDILFALFQERLNFHISSIFEKKIDSNQFRNWVSNLQNQTPSIVCTFSLGQSYFNARRYWHAHEAWECYWKTYPKRNSIYRLFLQGLIQFASGMYKIHQKININGAINLLNKSYEKLSNNIYTEKILRKYNSMDILEYIRKILKNIEEMKGLENPKLDYRRNKNLPNFLIISKFQNINVTL